MKKVIVPFEGERYPRELLDFGARLHDREPFLLTAVFMPQASYADFAKGEREMAADRMAEVSLMEGVSGSALSEDESQVIHYQCRQVKRFCAEREISLKVHLDTRDFALPSLKAESRCADLLLLSGAHFFEEQASEQPNAWMREILHRSECPVLLLPDGAELPGELILAYDGSADSAFAIRQFAYLFPEFMGVQATLVYINDDPDAKIPNEAEVRELCSLHYKKFRFLRLKMRSAEFYRAWIGMMSNPWLVAGSYGRSSFSEFLSRSFSEETIREHRIPVFVTHK